MIYNDPALFMGKKAALISFTIDGRAYQAEEGMTFTEWVNSSYNTDNFWISASTFVISPLTNKYVREELNDATPPASTIKNGKAYVTKINLIGGVSIESTNNEQHSGGTGNN